MDGLEVKFCRAGPVRLVPSDGGQGATVEGYASVFGAEDRGGDLVMPGAFAPGLKAGRRVAMLWQHDPKEPIGVWDEVAEDAHGLRVKGRLLEGVARAREAAALIAGGALDGLSIGYRTLRAERDGKGRRMLREVELWEVSLVTFPMLGEARVTAKGGEPGAAALRELAAALTRARRAVAG